MLGPVEVRRDGRPLPVPAGKTSELLVRLALEPGDLVRADRLVDDLWSGAATRRNTLQAKVARLRRAVGDASVIVTADDGYRLAVAEEAEAERGTPWPQPLLSHYARFWRDGDRNTYEDRVRQRQQRLARAAITAAARDQVEWVDEVADGVGLICEQAGWSWAAHDDTHRVHGHVVPTDATPYLDLGAGEVAAELADLATATLRAALAIARADAPSDAAQCGPMIS